MLTHRATGQAALSETITPTSAVELDSVRIHLNAVGGAGSLTVTIDANAGAAYDVVLNTQDLTALADYVYQPTRPIPLDLGDKLVIAWANAGAKTYGLEVKYRTVPG